MEKIVSKRIPQMLGGSLSVGQLVQGIAQTIDGMENAQTEQDFLDRKDRARDLTQTLGAKLRQTQLGREQ